MNESSRFDPRLNHRGVALVTVLLVMLVLTILTTGVVVVSMNNYNQSSKTVDHNQAYYVAEAGVNYQVKMLETLVTANAKSTITQFNTALETWISSSATGTVPLSTVGGIARTYSSSIVQSGDNLTITSVGIVGSVSRVLKKTISLSGFKIDKAILTSGELDVGKSDIFITGGVSGEVQTLSIFPEPYITNLIGSVIIDKLATVNIVYIKDPYPYTTYDKVILGCSPYTESTKMMCNVDGLNFEVRFENSVTELPTVELPTSDILAVESIDYPKYYLQPVQYTYVDKHGKTQDYATPFISGNGTSKGNITISDSSVPLIATYTFSPPNTSTMFYTPKFEIDANTNDFTIDVGDNNIEILAGSLILNGSFKIKGKGSLTVYVDSAKFFTSCSKICGAIKEPYDESAKIADKFIVVVTGTAGNTYKFAGGGTYYLSLITQLNLDFKINGNFTYNGFLVSGGKNINFQGAVNGNMLIYAPIATVNMGGNASILGSIIAETYQSNGNAITIIYSSDYSNTPFNFLKPNNSISYGPTIEN